MRIKLTEKPNVSFADRLEQANAVSLKLKDVTINGTGKITRTYDIDDDAGIFLLLAGSDGYAEVVK